MALLRSAVRPRYAPSDPKCMVYPAATLLRRGYSTFLGVYLPSILSIFGVILYLRLGKVVADIGIVKTALVILFSSLIAFITGLSITARATNTPVGAGGAYFMLSRSFGIEVGAAIGASLYLAQIFGMAFYIEGFVESLQPLLPYAHPLALKTATLLAISLLTLPSSSFALKSQIPILVLVALSLLSIFFAPPSAPLVSAESSPSLPFWPAFAIFFPAVTGIEAGFSMSGDLKKPARSLPLGTLAAVLTGLLVYLALALFMWARVPTEQLQRDPLILMKIARFPPLVLLGIWGATLSSALTSFLSGPRTLQALAQDGVVPKLLATGVGAKQEPLIASLFSLLLIFFILQFGSINAIAPLLTLFFLISYGMLNLASGLESLFGNPSWRPSIPIPAAVSLLGGALSLFAMFMVSSGAAFLSLLFLLLFYLIVRKRSALKRLDDLRVSILSYIVKRGIYALAASKTSQRSWRPNCLVFASLASERSHLIEFAAALTQEIGFLTTVSIITSTKAPLEKLHALKEATQEFYRKKRVRSLVEVVPDTNFYAGMERLILSYGIGPITPNTVILGSPPPDQIDERFIHLLTLCQEARKNVVIVKEGKGPSTPLHAKQTIDIWCSEHERKTTHLMLALAHMLCSSDTFTSHPLVLKCLAPNAAAKQSRCAHLKNFLTRNRLQIETSVLLGPENPSAYASAIQEHSQNARLTLIGLNSPTTASSVTAFLSTFSTLSTATQNLAHNTAFVIPSPHLDLSTLYQ